VWQTNNLGGDTWFVLNDETHVSSRHRQIHEVFYYLSTISGTAYRLGDTAVTRFFVFFQKRG
jgi:hypothetical protein